MSHPNPAHDVVVVGGSVAGCAVAIALAEAGRRVLMLEQRTGPARKACGEGILPRGVAALTALGLRESVLSQGNSLSRVSFEMGTAAAEASLRGSGIGIRRDLLGEILLDRAIQSGVEVRTGVTARALEIAGGRVSALVTSDGRIPARAIVAADGLNSRLRRLAGLEARSRPGNRYGISAHARIPGLPEETIHVIFGTDHELYLTPVGGGQANVALLLRKPALAHLAGDPAALLRAALEANRSTRGTQLLDAPLVAGPFPRGARRAWRANLALAGDAAGFFDGITGEGMSLALATAPACAAAVSRFIDSGSDDGLREYDRVLVRTGRASTLLGRLTLALAHRRRLGRYAVGNLARRPATFEKLVAINGGEIPLRSLTPRDLLALATGW